MSSFKVEVLKIEQVLAHPNADRLEIVLLEGKDWQCVTQKEKFRPGDLAIYFPIDSILPQELESRVFGPDSKIKLINSRVKTIKIRGALSQGMVVKCEDFVLGARLGDDVTSFFKVIKYEPKSTLQRNTSQQKNTRKQSNPYFRKYTGIENAKNFPQVFTEGELVSVSEKIHGSSWRAAYIPFYPDTLWKKVKGFLGFNPKFEFVYGSHNVQLQSQFMYDENVYAKTVDLYKIKNILKNGEALYGEVYGGGIQKGYHYGCKGNEIKAVFFDVMIDGKYLDVVAFRKWAQERGLPVVPELYRGPFNKEKILALRDGNSVLCPEQKVREGVVVKPLVEERCFIGRKVLKYISDEYLLKNQNHESEAH